MLIVPRANPARIHSVYDLQRSGINYVEVPNEAAFYGPKIDVQAWSVIGREFSIATNQVDFAQPRSFDLRYKDRDNTEKTPLCIHRAPLGTHERFIGFLIEHYAGNFPLWLAPVQAVVIPIAALTMLATSWPQAMKMAARTMRPRFGVPFRMSSTTKVATRAPRCSRTAQRLKVR